MRALVYPDILHGGEVHTVAVDRSNTTLATSGKDGSILLWDVSQLVGVNKVKPDGIKQYLSSISPTKSFSYHQCLVKVVLWSPIDDHTFISADVSGKIYLNDGCSHDLLYPFPVSIVDITWSADGRLVSWSTVDGKVHLYDIIKKKYQLLSLITTQSIQRSIAFDPTNKYLITLGDDTIIYIYQYRYVKEEYQFKVLQHITRLMNQSHININYNRVSWSPGGEYVSIPSSNSNKATMITILSRSGWEDALNLVGHGTDCEVVRYNPQLFNKSETVDKANQMDYSNVIATAGSDKMVALWSTDKKLPILVLEDLVSSSIVDICWENSGNSLFLASLDGHLSIVTFEDKELGTMMDKDLWTKVIKPEPAETRPFNAKPEQSGNRKGNNTVEILDSKNAISAPSEQQIPIKYVEEHAPEGKESVKDLKVDIVPSVIPPPDTNDTETRDDLLNMAMASRSNSVREKPQKTVNGNGNKSNGTNGTNGTINRLDVSKQKLTVTKDGKKRVQPMLVSSNGDSNGNSLVLSDRSNGKSSPSLAGSKHMMELDKPSYNVSDDFLKSVKRQKLDDGSIKKQKRDLEPVKFIGSVVVNPNTTFSKTRLATPKVRLSFQLTSTVENDETFVLDIKNGSGNDAKPSRITYYKKDRQTWTDFIPKFIHLATEGSVFWAVSTADGNILTYSHISGRRLLPPLVLGSPLAFLESQGKYLMAITNIGELYVWDLELKKLHLKCPSSISALLENNTKYLDEGLSRSDKITLCSITSNGIPLMTLSNGSGYLFNVDLGVWQTITESWWAFGSHYWDSLSGDTSAKPQSTSLFGTDGESITSLLENKTNEEIVRGSRSGRGKFFNKISKNMLMKEGFENLENTISVSHLENRILCCELLGEKKDFHEFFISYGKRICELGLKAKIFEVCNELLGPDDKSNWNSEICGIKKHQLLKEVVLACSHLRDSQRILTYFADKIDLIEKGV